MERVLGLGSYGEVKLGRHKRSKVQVAIKKIPIDPKDKELVEMIFSEIKVLIQCVSLLVYNFYRITQILSESLMRIRKLKLYI